MTKTAFKAYLMMNKTSRTKTIRMGIAEVDLFEKHPDAYINGLVKFSTPRKVMLMVYQALIAEKKLDRIELLPEEDKRMLWNESLSYGGGDLDKKGSIELSKILYVLKSL